jgi:hypothetical protein
MMKHTMIIAGITIALMAGSVSAKEYYKWVDDKGVTRYAEQAPIGVKAEKINTYSGSSTVYDPNTATASTEDVKKEQAHKKEVNDQAEKLEKEEREKCAKVSEQRKLLTERGRVRMKDKEGNERILTPEEQAAKIVELEKYEKEMCNKK